MFSQLSWGLFRGGGAYMFFLIHKLAIPPLGVSNLMGPRKSIEEIFLPEHFLGAPNVINNVGRAFFAIQTHYTQ